MVILDYPYASAPLIQWLEETAHPVLENALTTQLTDEGAKLNLVDDSQAASLIRQGQRLYTNSENALAWLEDNVPESDLNRYVKIFKDKAEMRRLLAPLSPSLYFKTCTRNELESIDSARLPYPVVLKPSVGFCSMGVYAINNPQEWEAALADISENERTWNERYPQSVVDSGAYIIEGYITGQEYAIDMYYDSQGTPHILNILRHDFKNAEDTSDRLYVTNKDIADEMEPVFLEWLCAVNKVVGAKDFPAHVEVRVQDDEIIPIEFNPLRFAGLGGTDVAYYGFGLRTYASYLENGEEDLRQMLAGHAGKTYSMCLVSPVAGTDLERSFDYDAFLARFTRVVGFHRYDVNQVGAYGFLFLETDEDTSDELDFILTTDLEEFLD